MWAQVDLNEFSKPFERKRRWITVDILILKSLIP